MNTQIIQMVISWEKDLEVQQQESKRRRYYFGVEEFGEETTLPPCEEKRERVFNWQRPKPVCECRPKPVCECA